ncbi:winged helix-turn-helix transcriptional regulator [Nocardioides agariphilus]|jgi:DNA-binding MarR family transcriptional regulator|uniref:Winged helix-turn-helix transcriptional regulator n=1 Tax=Nocardioides agariphilus TaxID=433664 RepID=A0A930VNT7_9ACTN|nr:MarR family winged helix-turn-helix transcriptional regulator [Nocardioides agariphilus]MBF4769036.1 winged helix-turn-helix transcriptional regulator [Nocardioides agariphilus]
MSRAEPVRPTSPPLIALVHRANKALQANMVAQAHRQGHPEIKQSHNAVFGTLHGEGQRAVDMAASMGITRQSMGEIVREMVQLDILEMVPDPADRRAKLVTFSAHGLEVAAAGFRHIGALERRFAEEFGAADYETARRVLVRVAEMLEADDAEPHDQAVTPGQTESRRSSPG